ncbi:MAG: glutathione S-transferase family protein [Deltaproteobacteria bacterium]|nr:glutathione S-transferase family protein [Deltaproteobacteria bacterium]
MKLYFHPVSTASRPILLFCAESGIAYEPVVVDLMKGEHLQDAYKSKNPSALVPTIDDDGFVLSEASAILKYLADKHGSALYPKDLQKRARVNERMDWFNTQLYREYGYHLLYPQLFDHHKRPGDEAQRVTVEWGKEKTAHWLKVLDQQILGSNAYLCGSELTIADFFGAEILAAGDLVGCSFEAYPNVSRWMKSMRALPSWSKVHEATDGFANMLKDKPWVKVA